MSVIMLNKEVQITMLRLTFQLLLCVHRIQIRFGRITLIVDAISGLRRERRRSWLGTPGAKSGGMVDALTTVRIENLHRIYLIRWDSVLRLIKCPYVIHTCTLGLVLRHPGSIML